jgi:hypothetical protein
MTDRLLHAAWNGLVLGLIVALGGSSLALIYMALLRLVSKRLDQGITPLMAGALLFGAAYLVMRYRDDLIGDE